MDIGDVSLFMPTLSSMQNEIEQLVLKNIKSNLQTILGEISEKFHIPMEELQPYLTDLKFDLNGKLASKKKRKTPIEDQQRCQALTSEGKQCSRKRSKGDYCGSHNNSRPYGCKHD